MTTRIVHVIAKFSPEEWGGAEEVILNLSREQAARGARVCVFSTRSFMSPQSEQFWKKWDAKDQNVEVRHFSYFLPGSKVGNREEWLSKGVHLMSPSLATAVMMLPRKNTVVHLHLHNSVTSTAALCCLLRGIPYVFHLHSRYTSETKTAGNLWLHFARRVFSHHRALQHAATIVCPTEIQACRLRQHFPQKKVVAVSNAITMEDFASGDGKRFRGRYGLNDRPVLLNVAKIYPVKNQFFLLEVLKRLRVEFPHITLVLIGHVENRDYFSRLQQRISSAQLRDNVIIIPGLPAHSQELADAYSGSDCFLLPSKEEAFPLVVLEAWASKVPVLASGTDGTTSLIKSGVNGMLFKLSAEEWASGIGRLLASSELKQQFVTNGCRTLSSTFSWKAMADQVDRVYAEVLGTNGLHPQKGIQELVEVEAETYKK